MSPNRLDPSLTPVTATEFQVTIAGLRERLDVAVAALDARISAAITTGEMQLSEQRRVNSRLDRAEVEAAHLRKDHDALCDTLDEHVADDRRTNEKMVTSLADYVTVRDFRVGVAVVCGVEVLLKFVPPLVTALAKAKGL